MQPSFRLGEKVSATSGDWGRGRTGWPIAPGHHRPQSRTGDMTFDDGLAERLRHRFASVGEVSEKRMFGGLAFLVAGNMCLGIMGSESESA